MWFEPGDLSKTKTKTIATSATSATLEPENTKTAAKSRKVAEVAAPFNPEINNDHQKIISWLASIGEDDQGMIDETIGTQLQHDIRERIEERSAIMEYDGGLTRKDAEQAAAAAIRVYCYRTTEKPNSELVAIMPGVELDEATASLKLRYGDRLLEVYPSPYCLVGALVNTTKH